MTVLLGPVRARASPRCCAASTTWSGRTPASSRSAGEIIGYRLPRRAPARAAGSRGHPAARPGRHGVPAVQPLPAPDRAGEHRRGARSRSAASRSRGRRPRPRNCWRGSGWPDASDAYPRQLSGGQQQRVAIARALAMRAAAAAVRRADLARWTRSWSARCSAVIRDLAGDGMTMIVVTHEIGFAREVADTAVFLDGGRIVESGPPGRGAGPPAATTARGPSCPPCCEP